LGLVDAIRRSSFNNRCSSPAATGYLLQAFQPCHQLIHLFNLRHSRQRGEASEAKKVAAIDG
jgi:hypothetical protein